MLFGSTCLVMEEIQFSLIKKIKIGRPEHSLTPRPHTSDNISFLSSSPTPPLLPSMWTSYVYHPLSTEKTIEAVKKLVIF